MYGKSAFQEKEIPINSLENFKIGMIFMLLCKTKYLLMNWFEKLLLICSGSNLKILEKSPTEINKHIGIGGVILFTAVLASLSSGYALYSVFDNTWAAVGFGLLWGLMIFNLDRFIVASMRKSGNFFRQFFTALPRIVLAALLGVVIAKPLELRIFQKEIDKQLNVIINRNKTALQDSVNLRYAQLTKTHMEERTEIYNRINSLREAYNLASIELEKEVVGTASETTTGKVGYGPNAKRKEELKKAKKEELDAYMLQMQPRLAELDKEIDQLSQAKQKELEAASPTEDGYTGFAARMQALDELTQSNKILAIASIFIMGVFICLEMSPVLVKLISPKGPYDYLLDKHEFSFKLFGWESKEKMETSSQERVMIHKKKSERRIREEI